MKVIDCINCRWSEEDANFLAQLGIIVEPGEIISLCIEKGSANYNTVRDFCKAKKINDFCREGPLFEYSKSEYSEAEYYLFKACGSGAGYPLIGRSKVSFSELMYDMEVYCPECRTILTQKTPFRICSNLPKRPIYFFTSVARDVVFVTEELYYEVFEPFGIGWREVHSSRGVPKEGVVQLDLQVADESLDLSMYDDNNETEICRSCGRKKYSCSIVFPFFPIHDHPIAHMYLTKEYFGSGRKSFRKIIISKELAKKLMDRKVIDQGWLIPCKKNLAEYLKTIDYHI